MKEKFYFSLLRYVYDPLTQEFVNIGVVLYSPANQVSAGDVYVAGIVEYRGCSGV